MDPLSEALTRRRFLKLAGGGLAAAGMAPLLTACGGGDEEAAAPPPPAETGGAAAPPPAAAGGGKITNWWWGDQEAVGVQAWMDETIAKFTEETGTEVDALLLETDAVIPQFTNAAAAGKPPDVQFLWNGIYHMENVWNGYIAPMNGLVSDDVIAKSGATVLSNYEGQTYRAGFYALGFGLEYNKDWFDQAGLDGDNPPKTWDEFLDACDKLKSKNFVPLGGGVKDGYLGEWWLISTLTQNLDSAADAINLFVGNLDWEEPKYHEHWVKLQELNDNGYWNEDVTSITYDQGFQTVEAEKAAMTINNTPYLPTAQKTLGDRIGFFPMPVFGTGQFAGMPIVDSQGFGIAAKAENPEGAAAFVEFMHSQDRVNAMWTTSKAIPADEKFDSSLIDDPFMKSVYDGFIGVPHAVYIADLMPTLFWTDAMFVISQKILGGSMKGEDSGKLAAEVTQKWKDQNPDIVDKYTTWSNDLAAA